MQLRLSEERTQMITRAMIFITMPLRPKMLEIGVELDSRIESFKE